MEDSDLYSAGCVGLVKAASTFDPECSKFSTWATRVIYQSVLDEFRRIKRTKSLPFSSSEGECDGRNLPDPRRSVDFSEPLFKRLTTSDDSDTEYESENKRLMVSFFVDGRSLSELGREMGVTKETVRKRVNKAIESIRVKNAELIREHS